MLYIIIATYHEEDNIGAVIFHLSRTLKDPFFIVIDDSVTDETQISMTRAFTALGIQHYKYISRSKKYGLGSAYRHAMKEISVLADNKDDKRDDMVAILDSDLSHDPCDIDKLVKYMSETGADIVAGSRYQSGGSVSGWPYKRVIISSAANFIAKTVLGIQLTDCTSSMRLYKLSVIESLISQAISTGFSIQLELISLAVERGYKIEEIPIHFSERINGNSSLSCKEVYKFIMTIARLWWKQRVNEAYRTLFNQ